MEPIRISVTPPPAVRIGVKAADPVRLSVGTPQPPGDYATLANKPSIEGHTLIGDSTIGEIGVGELTPQEIDRIIFG